MHGGDIYNNDVDIDFSVNLNPYHTGLCDLSCKFMGENDVASSLAAAVLEGLEGSDRYPDIRQSGVRDAISEADGVSADWIYAGSGASQLLMASVRAIKPDRVMLTGPCFTGYKHALSSQDGCSVDVYGLKDEDGFAVTAAFADALSEDTDLIILTDPNNPTAKNIDEKVLVRILDRADELGIWVILDESFLMISDKYLKIAEAPGGIKARTAELINKYEKLFIIRSYTKSFALPGIRMGYVISRPENIRKVIRQLPEWNLSAISGAVMKRCAKLSADGGFYARSVEMISNERHFLEGELSAAGAKVFPGDSVFILFKGPPGLYEALLKEKILIRKCDDLYGLGENYYRVAVRSHDDNKVLTGAVNKIIRGNGKK